MSHDCNRREFMGGLASTLGMLSLSGMSLQSQMAYAADNQNNEYKDRYIVMLFMYGGWDVLLSLDPRDPTVFTESQKGLTLIQPGYQHAPIPTNANPLIDTPIGPLGYFVGDAAKHTDKLAIVRGLSMETLAHATAVRRLVSGKAPVGIQFRASTFDVWMSSLLGQDNPVPNIAIAHPTANLDQPGYASALRAQNGDQIYKILTRNSPYSDARESAIQSLLDGAASCPHAADSDFLIKASTSRNKISALLKAQLGESFNFKSNSAEMMALKQHYGGGKQLTGAAGRVAAVSQALKTGLSRVITAKINSTSLDTHTTLTTNGPTQIKGFNLFARLIEDLAASQYKDTEDSWLDRTTVVLSSEFTRSPLINTQSGRDHWLMNALLLAGGDIKGGTVIGGSSDIGMEPQPVDLSTGAIDLENGEVIKPEHVFQTLMKGLGVSGDPADYRAKPIDALLKSS